MILERYLRAASIEECTAHLAEYGDGAALLAGGTDLIPKMTQRRISVSTVIDLAHVPELCRIERDDCGVTVGAMHRLSALQKENLFTGPMAILPQCANHVSSMQIRNAATLGGNVCNASPAADTVPGLLVLDAIALVQGKPGAREVPLESFFIGPGKTALEPEELLVGVRIPHAPPHSGTAYRKYAIRGDSDISLVGVGVKLTLDGGGRIAETRIALASVGPTALRMTREEGMLAGAQPDVSLFKDVAEACADSCSPITDHRATKDYRKEMVRVWVEEALKAAFQHIVGSEGKEG